MAATSPIPSMDRGQPRPGRRLGDSNIGQGHRRTPADRNCGGRDRADRLALEHQGRPGRRDRLSLRSLIPLRIRLTCPSRVEPGDRLLPEVAPLHEVDRPGVTPDFLGQVVQQDIPARRAACPPRSGGYRTSLHQVRVKPCPAKIASDSVRPFDRADEGKARPTSRRLPDDPHRMTANLNEPVAEIPFGRETQLPEPLQESTVAWGPAMWNSNVWLEDILDRDVIEHAVLVEVRQERFQRLRLGSQEDHRSFGREQGHEGPGSCLAGSSRMTHALSLRATA